MRILHLIPSLGGGGAERQLSYLSDRLHQYGCDVHAAYIEDGPNKERFIKSGITLHKMPSISTDNPLLFFFINEVIRKIKPDIIQTCMDVMDFWGGLSSIANGLPFIVSQRTRSTFNSQWKSNLRKKVVSKASAIVANSIGGKNYWETNLPNHSGIPILMIRNGIPTEEIVNYQEIPDFDKKFELILFAGRCEVAKNPFDMLDTIEIILSKESNYFVVFCGDGTLLPMIKRRISNFKHKNRVLILGYVTNLWGWMKRAKVYVSLSLYEGCPNTVLEAMTVGCPIVVSDIPSHREFLDPEIAHFVPIGNPQEIANAISDSIINRKAALGRAEKAKESISTWSIDSMAKSYLALYSQIQKNAPKSNLTFRV